MTTQKLISKLTKISAYADALKQEVTTAVKELQSRQMAATSPKGLSDIDKKLALRKAKLLSNTKA